MSQTLTPYYAIKPTASNSRRTATDQKIHEIARLFRALNAAVDTLDRYYADLTIASASPEQTRSIGLGHQPGGSDIPITPSPFIGPLFDSFVHPGRGSVRLTYQRRVTSSLEPSRYFFEALACCSSDLGSGQEARVAVKFMPNYCGEAHKLLASMTPRRAPEVWYCERVESVGDMWVVVTSLVTERRNQTLRKTDVNVLRDSIRVLHDAGFVFGDLRKPSFVLAEEGPLLVDFDWCGKDGEARYPIGIEWDPEEVIWHEGVVRNGLITKEHDEYMLSVLSKDAL